MTYNHFKQTDNNERSSTPRMSSWTSPLRQVANSRREHFPVPFGVADHDPANLEQLALPCIDRHTETLAGKARSLLQNISGEFSRLPLDRILCHGAHDKARNLADRASENRRSSEFFAGWPKILDGHTGPFWVSSFVHGGFSDSCSDSGGAGRCWYCRYSWLF